MKKLSDKTKKVWNVILNVIAYASFALVLVLAVSIIVSGRKGYSSFFGTAFVAVESDSMDGDEKDSFSKGTLLKIKILSDEEKKNLKEGDVITFYDDNVIPGRRVLNSHRIVTVSDNFGEITFITKGDNNEVADSAFRSLGDIVGKVTGRTKGLGNVVVFLHSSTGFFLCVVTPSLLLLAYCIWYLIRVVREERKQKRGDDRDRLKRELLKELRAEGKLPPEETAPKEEAETSPDGDID